MFRPTAAPFCVLFVGSVLGASTGAGLQNQAPTAASLLAAARDAIGGDAKVRALKTLRLRGSVWSSQTVVGGHTRDTEEPLEIRVMFPASYLQVSAFAIGTQLIETRRGFIGDRVLSPRVGSPADSPADLRQARKSAAELLLAMLARTEAWGGLSFQVSGPNVLQVRGPNGYVARFQLDPATRVPASLSYRERRQVRVRPPNANLRPKATTEAFQGGGGAPSADSLPEIEITLVMRDHRTVAGLKLPSRITAEAQGVNLWEFRFTTIDVDPPLTAADFAG